MSLMVWLPLNGDLTNQGLSNITVAASGAAVNTAGKIGSCYSFDGSDDYISLVGDSINNCFKGGAQQFSIAFWIYRADATRGIVFGDYNLANAINFNFELNTAHQFRFYWAGSPDKVFSAGITASAWSHVALTYNGTTMKYYINGALKETYTVTLGAKTKTSGAAWYLGRDSRTGTTALNGRLNDFRLYDHCLSAKEVKEISKGLVLHYPLHGGEGGANLLKGIATQVATSAGLSSSGTLEYDSTLLPLKSLIGKTFIFSYDYSVEGAKANATGDWSKDRFGAHLSLTYKDASGNTGTAYPGAGYLEVSGTGRAIQSYTCSSSWTDITSLTVALQPYNKPASGNNNTWYIKNFKIELGNVDTGYSLNPNEVGNMGHMSDRAGYNHHGAVSGVLTYNSDSPRHNISAHIEGTDQINLFNLPYESIDNGTLSFWIKINKFKGWSHYVFIADAFNWTGTERDFIIVANNREETTEVGTANVVLDCCSYTSSHSMTTNQWYHITFTWDAKNYVIKKYINGNCVSTHDDSSNKRLNVYRLKHGVRRIGAGATGTSYYGNYNISDFRVYSTTMAESDIKELYQIPISIDKSGNTFGIEFIEDQKPEFHKDGIVEALDFYENLIFNDMEFKTLSDGSLWARILHHNNKGGTVLFTKDNAINYQSADLYSRLYALEGYRDVDGKFEFMAIQPDLDANKLYRWKQSSNPVTDSTIAGYENITNGQGGLVKCSGSTYCAVSATNSNWWCAVGCYTAYQGGIPGFGTNVVTGTLDLYVRIPVINKASIYKKQYIASNQIIEV